MEKVNTTTCAGDKTVFIRRDSHRHPFNQILSRFRRFGTLDVRLAAVDRASFGILHVVVVLFGGAGAAEEPPAQEQQPCGGPADVERGPQLPPLGVGQDGVVEVPDDGVGGPADGDQHQEASDDEDDACSDGHFALLHFILNKVGALAAHHSEEDPEDPDDDCYDDQRSGGLQVLRQRQEGVVDLALHLTRALSYAVHPQTLPDHLSGDNVGPDKGRDLPGGEGADDDAPQEADDGQGQTQDLSSRGHHAELCCYLKLSANDRARDLFPAHALVSV